MKGFGRKRLWPDRDAIPAVPLNWPKALRKTTLPPGLDSHRASWRPEPARRATYILSLRLCYDLSAEFHFVRVEVTKFYVQGRLKINCVRFSKTCKSSGAFAGHNTNLINAYELHPELVHIWRTFHKIFYASVLWEWRAVHQRMTCVVKNAEQCYALAAFISNLSTNHV
jgi:hypothetical protein